MKPSLRSRAVFWLALLGWLTQLCLPTAHAAVMAQHDAGMAAWCGPRTAAMAEQLAQLAPEVREILEKGYTQSGQHQDCAQFCASAAGAGMAPTPVTVNLRAAGLEAAPVPPVLHAHRAYSASEPARGPPRES